MVGAINSGHIKMSSGKITAIVDKNRISRNMTWGHFGPAQWILCWVSRRCYLAMIEDELSRDVEPEVYTVSRDIDVGSDAISLFSSSVKTSALGSV